MNPEYGQTVSNTGTSSDVDPDSILSGSRSIKLPTWIEITIEKKKKEKYAFHILAQIFTENHATFPIQIFKITEHI